MPHGNDTLVLAGPPSECCVRGVKHTGEPAGATLTIGGVTTYLTEPPPSFLGPRRVILFFSDIYGPFYLNNQLIQDYFASNGFTVLGIDYFFGDPVQNHSSNPGFEIWPWISAAAKKADEVVPGWIEAVMARYGKDAKYCAVGYCFGAPYTLELAATDKIAAAAFAHPANLDENHFKNVKQPLLLSCSEVDMTFPPESRHRAEEILMNEKTTYHLQVFSGVSHGFAVRADLEVESSRWAKEESARSVVGWFSRFTTTNRSAHVSHGLEVK